MDELFCLGDLGRSVRTPIASFRLLHDHHVQCVQGNYDTRSAISWTTASAATPTRRTTTSPRSVIATRWITPPRRIVNTCEVCQPERRLDVGSTRVLMCHGSPRQTNEFLWQSTSSTHFLQSLTRDYEADIILATHTGLKWHRPLGDGRHFVNVGVLGRPENDGHTNVWYTLLEFESRIRTVQVEFIPIAYDHLRLAREMAEEDLPPEFIETIVTGWWTTCLEILPVKERRRGRY